MDIKKLKEKLNKKVHPAWVWVLAVVMGLFSFISFNVLFEPSFIPAPIIDISKKIVGSILGDQDIDIVDSNDGGANNQNNYSQNDSNQDISVDTSNWKTYENKELGFSIKYPNDWAEYKKSESSISFSSAKDMLILKEEELNSVDTGNPYFFGKLISIGRFAIEPNKTIRDYASDLLSIESEGYIKDFETVNNLSGLYIYDQGPNRYGGGIGEYYMFLLDNFIYKISFDHEMLSEKVDENLSSIVKNFALNFKKY